MSTDTTKSRLVRASRQFCVSPVLSARYLCPCPVCLPLSVVSARSRIRWALEWRKIDVVFDMDGVLAWWVVVEADSRPLDDMPGRQLLRVSSTPRLTRGNRPLLPYSHLKHAPA